MENIPVMLSCMLIFHLILNLGWFSLKSYHMNLDMFHMISFHMKHIIDMIFVLCSLFTGKKTILKMIWSGYDYIEKDFVATDYFIFEGYPEVILEPLDAPLLLKTGCYRCWFHIWSLMSRTLMHFLSSRFCTVLVFKCKNHTVRLFLESNF